MASLIDVSDIRLFILYNSGKDIVIFNRGYQRDPGSLVFQNYSCDAVKGELRLGDTFSKSRNSDLKVLKGLKRFTLAILGLCKNGAAREGFMIHDVQSFISENEKNSSHPDYNDYQLVCQGGYRKLSKSELARGSRFSATEV